VGHASSRRPHHPHPRCAFPSFFSFAPFPLRSVHFLIPTLHTDSFFSLPHRPQTKSIKYLEENFASRDVELSEDDLKAVREIIENNPVLGEQYNAKFAAMIDRD
jgi:hypothetical protein